MNIVWKRKGDGAPNPGQFDKNTTGRDQVPSPAITTSAASIDLPSSDGALHITDALETLRHASLKFRPVFDDYVAAWAQYLSDETRRRDPQAALLLVGLTDDNTLWSFIYRTDGTQVAPEDLPDAEQLVLTISDWYDEVHPQYGIDLLHGVMLTDATDIDALVPGLDN